MSLWVRGLVTSAVLAVMFRSISPTQALETIGRLRLEAAIIVLALLAVDRLVMVWRWVILLRATGQPIRLKSAVWIYLVSSFVGSFLPAGVGGDMARAYTLYERTSQGSAAAASVAVDRLLGLLSIVLVGIAGAAFGGAGRVPPAVAAVAVLVVAVGAAALLWSDRWLRVALPASWTSGAAGSRILRLADAMSAYRGHRGALVAVSALSVGVQLLRILQAYVLGVGIGIQVPFSYYLVFMPAGLIALMLPISVSGFGAPQGLIVWLLRPAGVADADSFALSTLIILSGILANLPGALLYLRRQRSGIALAMLVCIAAGSAGSCTAGPQPREPLREIYTPRFERVPPADDLSATAAGLRADLDTAAGESLLARLAPDQSGVLWIALIVTLVVGFDFERPRSRRNIDLVLLLALGTAFFNIAGFFRVLGIARYWVLLDAVFAIIFAVNLALLIRAFVRAGSPDTTRWTPNLSRRALATVALILLVCNAVAALARRPDDAGWFINLGAQRLRERGTLPFGDPLLTGTAGAAYGPVLYALHVPLQIAVSPRPVNVVSADRPLDSRTPYYLPPLLATKLCTLALHLLGVFALFHIARRLGRSPATGWALVALYCGSAFVLGVGGTTELIGGMTFVSHVGPAALTLAAFAMLARPAAAGALLAVAAGAGFYPLFFAPAWAGFYWPRRPDLMRYAAGFAVTGAIVFGATVALSRPADGRGRVGTILHDTFGHHTDPASYGRSPFGFWGQRLGVRGWLARPLAGGSGLLAPTFLAFAALCAAAFFRARGRSAPQLALITGALALGASMIKIHATGCYVAWAYPFLLVGFLLDANSQDPTPNSQT